MTRKQLGYACKHSTGRLVLERFGQSLSELEVEISDDLFVLRAEYAQKLVTPPRLAKLMLNADHVEIGPNQHITFKLTDLDQYWRDYPIGTFEWIAPGFTIDENGHLVVSEVLVSYTVTAQSGWHETDAQVHVSPTDQVKKEDKGKEGREDHQMEGNRAATEVDDPLHKGLIEILPHHLAFYSE